MSWQTSLIFVRNAAAPAEVLDTFGCKVDPTAAPLDFDTATSSHADGPSFALIGDWLVIAEPGYFQHLPITSAAEQRVHSSFWHGGVETRLKALSKSDRASCYYFALAGPVDSFGFGVFERGRVRRRVLAEAGERLRKSGRPIEGETGLHAELTEEGMLELIERFVPFAQLSAASFQPCLAWSLADPWELLKSIVSQIEAGENVEGAVASLDQFLRSPNPLLRSVTLRFIVVFGPPPKSLAPALEELLEDRAMGSYFAEERMRVWVGAACSLLLIDPADPVARERIERAMRQERATGSLRCICDTLGKLGAQAAQFVPWLRRLAASKDFDKSVMAEFALKTIAPEVARECEERRIARLRRLFPGPWPQVDPLGPITNDE